MTTLIPPRKPKGTLHPATEEGLLAKRKIVIVCLHADPFDPAGLGEGGGTHSYLRELIGFCSAMSMRYVIMTRWANKDLPALQSLPNGGLLIRLQIGPVGPLDKRILDQFHDRSVASIELATTQTIGPPDIIHSAYWNSGRAAMDLSRQWHCSFVHTVISNGWRRLQSGMTDQPACRLAVEQSVFDAADQIFCVSDEEARDLCTGYRIDPDKLVVVGRPVEERFLDPCRDGAGRARSPLVDLIAPSWK
jgi:D-inositol-3-phosphate glycosyltransferase